MRGDNFPESAGMIEMPGVAKFMYHDMLRQMPRNEYQLVI